MNEGTLHVSRAFTKLDAALCPDTTRPPPLALQEILGVDAVDAVAMGVSAAEPWKSRERLDISACWVARNAKPRAQLQHLCGALRPALWPSNGSPTSPTKRCMSRAPAAFPRSRRNGPTTSQDDDRRFAVEWNEHGQCDVPPAPAGEGYVDTADRCKRRWGRTRAASGGATWQRQGALSSDLPRNAPPAHGNDPRLSCCVE